MIPNVPLTRDLVLVGGGHTHALVLKRWGMDPLPGARLTVIDPGHATAYSGMLPGFVAGHYDRDELDIDLVKLSRHAGARFIRGAADAIDLDNRTVSVDGRPPIHFDVLSLDVGAHSALAGIDGFDDRAVAAKPLGPFASAWTEYLESPDPTGRRRSVVVLGGGIAGVELSLAMAHQVAADGAPSADIHLFEQSDQLMTGLTGLQRRALEAALHRSDVGVETGRSVTRFAGDRIEFDTGEAVSADFIVSAAGARAHGWLARSGLANVDGFVSVDPHLRSSTDPSVFAVGDCAHMAYAPREKAGVFAVRQAPVLFENLKSALAGGPLKSFRPQSDYLKLVSTGRKSAIALKYGLAIGGDWLWRLKDRIDRRFMRRLSEFPEMDRAVLPARAAEGVQEIMESHPPLCGGCGAKVDRAVLTAALPDGLSSEMDDAAVMEQGDHYQVLSTDHLRGFSDDPWMVAKTAAVHALGDIWAMGVEPKSALASIILPEMSADLQQRTITEIMAAASSVFADADASIVGGHTSVGAELTIGFTVAGECKKQPITLTGAQAGDLLVLTKPIGVGIILAAEMAIRARGEWVMAALDQMTDSLGKASAVLAEPANAMTDVTGFGLAGHLLNMLQASGVGAEIVAEDIPVLPGATELLAEGVRPSLWGRNRAAVANHVHENAPCDVIYDPQTSGGLLAAVPASRIEAVLAEFHNRGEPIWQIGQLVEGPPSILVR